MVGFRVDANETIATGHLMRCIAIAEMCRKKGEDVCFFLAEDKETGRLKERGFMYCILQTDWKNMETELEQLEMLLRELAVSVLVVDSYQAVPAYLRRLNKLLPVLYLDDMEKELYPVSAVLHYGIGTDTKEYLEQYRAQGIRVLAGTRYIPLREEFFPERSAISGNKKSGKETLSLEDDEMDKENGTLAGQCVWKTERENRILVTTGGTDPFHIAEKLLDACLSCEEKSGAFLREWEYDVIIGALNRQTEGLEQMAEKNPCIHLHHHVTNMSVYMKTCKMAVSAGGTTLYELCACGIPAVCFSFADNQEPCAGMFGERGIMDYAGDARRTEVTAGMVKALIHLEQEDAFYAERQRKMLETVDGRGAVRVAEEILLLRR